MRKCLIVLMSILLAGCVDDSASYLIDGNNHALTLRRQQQYFWKDEASVTLLASRMPDCQRLHPLASIGPTATIKMEVFQSADDTWNIRMGNQLWQIETQTCNTLTELQNDPNADLGTPVGSFSVQNGKLVFVPVATPSAPAGAAAEASGATAAEASGAAAAASAAPAQ